MNPTGPLETEQSVAAYNRQIARWRSIVDWAKHKPWLLKCIQPMARGKGRLRFFDQLHSPRRVNAPDFSRWSEHSLAACWIGHATVLLKMDDCHLITDPVFSNRVGLGWGLGTLGPARYVAPACPIKSLPRLDVILISHAHFDHLDRPTLVRMDKRATVVCPTGVRDLLDDLGFAKVIELNKGESCTISGVDITSVPVRHWGARTVIDRERGYCAYLLQSKTARVLYGADSAYQEDWKSIGQSGGVDLAIVGIGAYNPWIEGHADPEQAFEMTRHAGARAVMPIHHTTFKLSQEPMEEPLQRFNAALKQSDIQLVGEAIGSVWSANQKVSPI